jgi:glycosyltransferase involved in cell wall biosynthesis
MMLGAHHLLGTWAHAVNAYIALSRFARERFIAAGLQEDKVHIKPNFLLDDPGTRDGPADHVLFVGRLAPEKGILELLQAWRRLPHIPLVIAGDGPLWDRVSEQVRQPGSAHVKLLGQLGASDTKAQMKRARFLVFPSRGHEPFSMTLLEAAACGLPAVAARVGGIPDLVHDGSTGVLFDPQDSNELVARADWAWAHPAEMATMGSAARQLYLQKYTAEKNYELLMSIYQAALANSLQRPPADNAGAVAADQVIRYDGLSG